MQLFILPPLSRHPMLSLVKGFPARFRIPLLECPPLLIRQVALSLSTNVNTLTRARTPTLNPQSEGTVLVQVFTRYMIPPPILNLIGGLVNHDPQATHILMRQERIGNRSHNANTPTFTTFNHHRR